MLQPLQDRSLLCQHGLQHLAIRVRGCVRACVRSHHGRTSDGEHPPAVGYRVRGGAYCEDARDHEDVNGLEAYLGMYVDGGWDEGHHLCGEQRHQEIDAAGFGDGEDPLRAAAFGLCNCGSIEPEQDEVLDV